MTVNFNSSVCVGQTGSFDPRTQLLEKRHQKDQLWLGGQSSLYGYLETQGVNVDKVLNRIENNMGYSSGSLSWGRSVVNNEDPDSILFLDSSGAFVETNFKNNFYEVKSEKQITSTFCDWSLGRPYDAYSMNQSGFTFYQLFSTGSGDGQQDSIYLNRFYNPLFKWGLSTIMQLEVGQPS